jgi:hypothetical protein
MKFMKFPEPTSEQVRHWMTRAILEPSSLSYSSNIVDSATEWMSEQMISISSEWIKTNVSDEMSIKFLNDIKND